MPVPNIFATATATIPLSQLDANFATTITLGNTAIQLGNTVSTLNNMTLANVTISSGIVTVTNATVTTANVTTANIATAEIANVTVSGVATFAAGSNAAPSITTTGDTNTGIFFPAADTVAIGTGGTERTRVSSDGTFRVKGAGTAGSTDAFQVSGSAPASAMTLDANGFQLLNSVAEIRAAWVTDISGTQWGFLKLASASNNFAGRIDLWMRAQDSATPNSAVYSIAGYSNAGRTENYFSVTKSERIANSVLIVTDASGNLYLAVSKGNANGGAAWCSRITADAITGMDGKTVTFAANLTGYTTRQTL